MTDTVQMLLFMLLLLLWAYYDDLRGAFKSGRNRCELTWRQVKKELRP